MILMLRYPILSYTMIYYAMLYYTFYIIIYSTLGYGGGKGGFGGGKGGGGGGGGDVCYKCNQPGHWACLGSLASQDFDIFFPRDFCGSLAENRGGDFRRQKLSLAK